MMKKGNISFSEAQGWKEGREGASERGRRRRRNVPDNRLAHAYNQGSKAATASSRCCCHAALPSLLPSLPP